MPDSDTQATLSLNSRGISDLEDLAIRITDFAGDLKVWLLEGEMGAGKTTLAKTIFKRLGVQGTVQSPTFSLVNEYEGKGGEILYHFDFYRIKHEAEALDIGVEEYFDSGNYCLVEWPSKIPSLIPDDHLMISITLMDPNQRNLHLSRHGQ
jgi:tRNA threonylcarbamoyladenosine biosynthesis protein TsaE